MATKKKSRFADQARRFIRICAYQVIPASLLMAIGWLKTSSWAVAPLLIILAGGIGTAWRVMFPDIQQSDVVVGRVNP